MLKSIRYIRTVHDLVVGHLDDDLLARKYVPKDLQDLEGECATAVPAGRAYTVIVGPPPVVPVCLERAHRRCSETPARNSVTALLGIRDTHRESPKTIVHMSLASSKIRLRVTCSSVGCTTQKQPLKDVGRGAEFAMQWFMASASSSADRYSG